MSENNSQVNPPPKFEHIKAGRVFVDSMLIQGYYDEQSSVVINAPVTYREESNEPEEIQEPRRPRFEILAYSGGKMHLPELKYPIVVDLDGIKTRQATPILYKHNDDAILGQTDSVNVTGRNIQVAGNFNSNTYRAYEVLRMANEGFVWQASIRAQATLIHWIDDGDSETINQQEITGPCYVADESILREVTIAPIGIDPQTEVTIMAMFTDQTLTDSSNLKEPIMSTKTGGQVAPTKNQGQTTGTDTPATLPTNGTSAPGQTLDVKASYTTSNSPSNPAPSVDPVAAYNARIAANEERIANIRNICASYDHPTFTPDGETQTRDLCSYAIQANWEPAVVKAIAARFDRPQGMAIHTNSHELPTELVIEAALCRGGGLISIEKQFSPQTLETIDRNSELRSGIQSLQQLLLMCAYIGGMADARRFSRLQPSEIGGVIRAAFSTNAMSSILSNVANKFMKEGFGMVEQQWRKIAAIGSSNNFLQMESYRLVADGQFELIPPSGEIPAGKVSDVPYTNQVNEYGKFVSVDRKAIINDNIGLLTQVPRQLARGAAKSLNKIFWAKFLEDNNTFFTTGRGNYKAGATTDLNLKGYSLAAEMLRTMPDGSGPDAGPMDTRGRYVVCNVADEPIAQSLFTSQNLISGKESEDNVFRGRYEPVASAFLTDPDEWYLLADPMDVAMIEVAFLNGQTEPIISEALPLPTHTGFVMNGLYDFGVNKQEFRGGVRMKGKV